MTDTAKPRILFIVQLPPPLHGASMMNSHLVASKVLSDNFSTETVNLHFVEAVQQLGKFSFGKIWKTMLYALEIMRKVKKHKPDLVYFNLTPKGFAFYRDSIFTLILKLQRQKIVFHLQSKGISENVRNNRIRRFIYRNVFRNTSIICLSPRLRDDFEEIYKDEPFYVPNGIEIQEQVQRPYTVDQESVPVIMYLSHYMKTKGILVLIEALGNLKKQGCSFTARLIGPPADLTAADLQKEVARRDLTGEVTIAGPKYGSEKFDEFRKADIFVFPTYYEVFGLVILEAMQFSLPVVASVEGAIPDIVVDGVTGFLAEKQDAEALAVKIRILLEDRNLRIKMGEEGHRRFLENYTVDKFEHNICETIKTILKTGV